MQRTLFAVAILTIIVSSCVPKTQYDAVVTERNYYRNEANAADSLADLQAISTYDEVGLSSNELEQRIQQVESLTATNLALNQSYQALQTRYQELLDQNQQMLSTSGNQVTDLQQSLAERTAEVTAREAELRQLELDLQAREEAIARLENAYTPAGGGDPTGPATYGTVSARSPLNPTQNAALELNTIQSDVNQLLEYLPPGDVVIAGAGINRLQISLPERVLYSDGFTVSLRGQELLRKLAGTLRNYPRAEFLIVGHMDSQNQNALRAYEDSTDKAINVAQQLVNYGLNPGKLTAGGKGFYDPISPSNTTEGATANRRTDIFITVNE
ncbi:OmpA family protein [Lewinella sp. W8]|uniref:OmpA family protein n=1 Tax=Lewinella sp. W8 TaxID=2528208 RepID=UPI00106878BD|nr:OmpA family protein [Lewinella sp. W8]MTB53800.1 OmpA family protein [Lewinella sp. W8]